APAAAAAARLLQLSHRLLHHHGESARKVEKCEVRAVINQRHLRLGDGTVEVGDARLAGAAKVRVHHCSQHGAHAAEQALPRRPRVSCQ
ncbi:hypothetical protein PFISCL1PPCAC_21290, partial [Pristionchus fissidentatus]